MQNTPPLCFITCSFCIGALPARVVETGIAVSCGRVRRVAVCTAAIAEAVPEVGTYSTVATEGTAADGAYASTGTFEVLERSYRVPGVAEGVLAEASGMVVEAETARRWDVVSTEPKRPCPFAHMWADNTSRV